jgi:antitoxin ChpS
MEATRILGHEVTSVVQAFSEAVRQDHEVLQVIVFGSRANGTSREDSDIDIAIVMPSEVEDLTQAMLSMSGLAFDFLVETGLHIHPFPIFESDLENVEEHSNPALVRSIRRDGLQV